LNKWVALGKKGVRLGKMGHSWKNRVTLSNMGSTGKKPGWSYLEKKITLRKIVQIW